MAYKIAGVVLVMLGLIINVLSQRIGYWLIANIFPKADISKLRKWVAVVGSVILIVGCILSMLDPPIFSL